MVLKITKILILLFLLSFCFLTACEEIYTVDCSQCKVIEPTTCKLQIKFGAIPGSFTPYNVTIYRGKIEDGVVLYNVETITSVYYEVALNSLYTVTVSVMKNGKEYIAVDATRPRVDVITEACEETCYYVLNNTLDLKIKYY
ncbi:MAG: hypothetical protein U9N72_08470 [Bacteroidota bacterium]|nr:hypothetical protein [Bacteroidota bacterium]